MVKPLGAGALLVAAMLGEAGAQTIRHDVNGQTQTFDFKQQGSAKASTGVTPSVSAGKPRPATAEPPRGSRSIPWDEPGKINGVPGVLENTATTLPAPRPVAKSPPRPRRERVEERIATTDQDGVAAARAEPSLPRIEAPIRQAQPDAAKPPSTSRRETPEPGADLARTRDDAEARAKIIADATARARAEEQRRLELERSKDRHARRGEPQSAAEATAHPVAPAQTDPASTGAIGAMHRPHHADRPAAALAGEPQPSSAAAFVAPEPAPSGLSWKEAVCKKLFFGILPGC